MSFQDWPSLCGNPHSIKESFDMKQHKKNGRLNPKYLFLALLAVCCLLIAISFTWGATNNIVQKTVGTVIVPMQKGLNLSLIHI